MVNGQIESYKDLLELYDSAIDLLVRGCRKLNYIFKFKKDLVDQKHRLYGTIEAGFDDINFFIEHNRHPRRRKDYYTLYITGCSFRYFENQKCYGLLPKDCALQLVKNVYAKNQHIDAIIRPSNLSASSVSGTIFHATQLIRAARILESDEFVLSTSLGTDADDAVNKKQRFYLSCTRTRLGHYHVTDSGYGSVLLTLDGNKLNTKYKSSAVDYWGEEFRKHRKGAYEEEDRVFSDKPVIRDARSYIKRIDVFLKDWESKKALIRKIKLDCLKYNIPIYFYDDSKSWLSGNTQKSYKIPVSSLTVEQKENTEYKYFDRSVKREDWGKGLRRESLMWIYQELVFLNDYNKLSKSAKNRIYRISFDTFNEQYTVFKSDVHNNKSDKVYTQKVINLMKVTNTKSLKELFDFIKAKWLPIFQQRN